MKRSVKKASERRKEIVSAARKLLLTKEYEKVTMQELMDKLNIVKGTMYHYFSSKEELLEAVVEDLVGEEFRKKEEIINRSKSMNLSATDTMQMLSTADTELEDHACVFDMLHHSGNIEMHARQLGCYLTKLAPLYAAVIEDGCTQGIFTTEHPLEGAEFLLAGIQFLTNVGFYPWNEERLVQRMEAFPALVESMLQAPKGSFSFLAE